MLQSKDYVRWEKCPKNKFIQNALNPAKDVKVTIKNEDKKEALAVANDENLSLAIGKKGQNAKLASKLTHFKIDIKNYQQASEMGINFKD